MARQNCDGLKNVVPAKFDRAVDVMFQTVFRGVGTEPRLNDAIGFTMLLQRGREQPCIRFR